MPNSEKVSGTAKNSTRTAPITPYSDLKSEEQQSQFTVLVFGGVIVSGNGFGHCVTYKVQAKDEEQAIARAMRIYARRPNALKIQEARIINQKLFGNDSCNDR